MKVLGFFLLLFLVATWQAPCHISPCLFSTSYSFPIFFFFVTRECLRDKPNNKFIVLDPLCKHHCVALLSPNPEPLMFWFASLWSSGAMLRLSRDLLACFFLEGVWAFLCWCSTAVQVLMALCAALTSLSCFFFICGSSQEKKRLC